MDETAFLFDNNNLYTYDLKGTKKVRILTTD
jgi:hypothetical protein